MFIFALFPILAVLAAPFAQFTPVATDLASLLILLAGPAAATVASKALGRSVWFRSLDSSGKLLTVGAVTILIAAAATGAQQFLISHPVVNAQLDPYVKAALFAVTFVASQVSYGNRVANNPVLLGMGSDEDERKKTPLPITPAQLEALLERSSLGDIAYHYELKVVDQPAGVEALAEPPNPDAQG